MAAKKNLSIEEILASCRRTDGAGGDGTDGPSVDEGAPQAEVTASADPSVEEAAASEAPAAKSSSDKPAGQMSVAEMLAAARGEKAGGGASESGPAAAPSSSAAGKSSSAAPKDPNKMSVAEMLSAARSEKGTAAAAKKPKTAAKPAAKPAAAKDKASPKPPPSGPKDTSSILAAARKSAKPGPMTKAEAAKQAKAEPKAKAKIVAPPMPEKPGYAKPKPAPAAQEDRRGFISVLFGTSLAVGFSCLAAISGLWTLGVARFMFPNILTEPPSRFKVGFPADFAPDTVTTKFKAQFGVWVVNTIYEGERQITALKSVCTHLGCTPNWLEGEQKFKCPCHGSGFYKDGINFEGPAPRPLERYAISLADDGQLEVDKSKKFQQELGQWASPSSFVAV